MLALRVLAERLEAGEAAPGPLTVSFQTAKEYRLGVLLVHGIGAQRLGETLVRWGDILLKTIDHATHHRVEVIAGPACPEGKGHRADRVESVVRLRAGDREERWLLAEGWWADAFLAPSYRELVSWSVRALPWSIALYIAQRYWQAVERDGVFTRGCRAAIAAAQLLAALALAPLFILFLMLVLILGLLPIPQLRSLILAAQWTLAATVGDSFAFLESPIRAALIRTRILDGLERLKQQCERTIIIAHSQGAAVVLDALGAIPEPTHDVGQAGPRDAPAPDIVPDTLVTFGAGTNQLASLKVLLKGPLSRIERNPTLQVILTFWITAFLSALLYADVISHRTTPQQILVPVMVLLLGLALCGLAFWLSWWLIPLLRGQWPAVQKYTMAIAIAITVLFYIAPIVAVVLYTRILGWDIRVNFLVIGFAVVMASISTILSKNIRDLVTIVCKPPGLSRWIDLFASADPVPNGPTRRGQTDVPDRSIRISNLGSILADHTTYWDNLDGFVLRIVTECAKTAESPWLHELPPVTDGADKRSAWRVEWLRRARWVVILTWLGAFACLWFSHRKDVPLPLELPAWLPALAETATRFGLLAALIAVLCWASLGFLGLLWRFWTRIEQEAVLAHRKPTANYDFWWLSGMCFVVSLIVVLAYQITEPTLPTLLKSADVGTVTKELMQRLFAIYIVACFPAMLLLWLRPAPEEANSEPADVGG
jgi:hypothetical protein